MGAAARLRLIGFSQELPMALALRNLDEVTRQHMTAEIEADNAAGTPYFSSRLNLAGRAGWLSLLAEAARANHDEWLASEIRRLQYLNDMEQRKSRTGNVTLAKVPVNAHEVMGEGEFNRFYMRAICLRAIAGKQRPEVYRARHSSVPRPESERLIGQQLDPALLLVALRASPDKSEALPHPNSGISIFLPV